MSDNFRFRPVLTIVNRYSLSVVKFFAFVLIVCLLPANASSGNKAKPQDAKKGGPFTRNLEDAYPNFIIRPVNADAAIYEVFSLTKKANTGDAIAQHDLGLCYLEGFGTVPDTVKAAYWIGRAARQGHAVANFNRAVFAMNGWGVPWNPFESYDGLRFAADAGMKEAQYYMSRFLIENLVVARNIPLAFHYVKLACDSGYVPAKAVMAEFVKNGWDKEEAQPAASSSKSRESSKSNMDKKSNSALEPVFLSFSHDTATHPAYATLVREAKEQLLGPDKRDANDSYADGANTVVDSLSAEDRTALIAATDRANPEALIVVGQWYEKGNGVRKDLVKAASSYLRALRLDSPRAPKLLYDMVQHSGFMKQLKTRVDAKDPMALYTWAELTANGFDNSITENQIFAMLSQSARLGYTPAVIALGSYAMAGFVSKKDPEKAMALWKQAADDGSAEAADRLLLAKILSGAEVVTPARWRSIRTEAGQGSVLAQLLAGICAEQGLGVEANKRSASQWYREAASRGSNAGFDGLNRVYDSLRPASKEYEVKR